MSARFLQHFYMFRSKEPAFRNGIISKYSAFPKTFEGFYVSHIIIKIFHLQHGC